MTRYTIFFISTLILLTGCYSSNKHIRLIRAPKKEVEAIVRRNPIDKKERDTILKPKKEIPKIDTSIKYYEEAYKEMKGMLNGTNSLSFKRAVFLTENAYWNNELDYELFCKQINDLTILCNAISKSRELLYNGEDKKAVQKHASVFTLLTDTLKIGYRNEVIDYPPFTYDFDDFSGSKDWSKMFVTKLISSRSGNCHSLPFLYKILVEELGEDAYLSLAPNHIYIKLYNKQNGWYNTELTSGVFPIDAWLMASGYIHTDAIRNGIYMDTLSNKQSIAVCLTDLAQGYSKKYGTDSTAFVLKSCNTVLKYFPNYINALLLRAETYKKVIEQSLNAYHIPYEQVQNHPTTKVFFELMQKDFIAIHQLGYRKMPDSMYLEWLLTLKEEKNKYQNKKITTFNHR